jgi:hypothetical protein
MRDRNGSKAAIGEAHPLRGPGRGQKLEKHADAIVGGDELADLKVVAILPAQGDNS